VQARQSRERVAFEAAEKGTCSPWMVGRPLREADFGSGDWKRKAAPRTSSAKVFFIGGKARLAQNHGKAANNLGCRPRCGPPRSAGGGDGRQIGDDASVQFDVINAGSGMNREAATKFPRRDPAAPPFDFGVCGRADRSRTFGLYLEEGANGARAIMGSAEAVGRIWGSRDFAKWGAGSRFHSADQTDRAGRAGGWGRALTPPSEGDNVTGLRGAGGRCSHRLRETRAISQATGRACPSHIKAYRTSTRAAPTEYWCLDQHFRQTKRACCRCRTWHAP